MSTEVSGVNSTAIFASDLTRNNDFLRPASLDTNSSHALQIQDALVVVPSHRVDRTKPLPKSTVQRAHARSVSSRASRSLDVHLLSSHSRLLSEGGSGSVPGVVVIGI